MEATLAPAAVKQQAIKRREDEPAARTGKDPKDGVPGLLLLAYKWRYPLWIQRHHKNGPRHFSRYDHACMFCDGSTGNQMTATKCMRSTTGNQMTATPTGFRVPLKVAEATSTSSPIATKSTMAGSLPGGAHCELDRYIEHTGDARLRRRRAIRPSNKEL